MLLFALTSFLPAAETSERAPLAARALLLDIARAGDRLVAVGAYGNVVVSTDEGASWRQVLVPTRALLTAVCFPDERHGWAVGHDGVILATADGGDTWTRQDSGEDLETVFLDVLFLDERRGFAAGAYGKLLETSDGGKTWTAAQPSDEEPHFNAVRTNGRWLYLPGEAGTLLVHSHAWVRVALPYDGSLFGLVAVTDQILVAYGLRGHILRSEDAGGNWVEVANDLPALILGGTVLRDGRVVLAGQGGNFFVSRDRGASFTAWKPGSLGAGVAELIEANDGALVTVGEAGVVRVRLP